MDKSSMRQSRHRNVATGFVLESEIRTIELLEIVSGHNRWNELLVWQTRRNIRK